MALVVGYFKYFVLSKDLAYICTGIITGQNQRETTRMNKIIDFVIKNFNREIALSEAADIANMAENSFSRYFSQRTRKSFTSFVNEVRLNHASKLLIETDKSVTEIGMDCGFSNLSNFNRQFRKQYNNNPLSFKKLYVSE
jgi:transcriptional regulator GlxA family with amidase domain